MSPLCIGLTGGIGSGKSTVAAMLSECGATLIDADAISRSATTAGGQAMAPIAAAFGADFMAPDGSLDRDRMRQLVFTNPSARQRLEAIVHPVVGEVIQLQMRRATEAGSRCVVVDIPLLVESLRWRPVLHRVLVVDCSEATQKARVAARESGRPGWTPEATDRVMASQASRTQRLAAADICIHNDGISLPELQDLVRRLAPCFGL
ncbi:dephospho-CoA kinase [Polaromonas sp. YR568]|uniref:dephospho-CoA kinase n=1 Tax=Polaromonas sp. YR568 TaxID=1855301 RepID=UPI003137B764